MKNDAAHGTDNGPACPTCQGTIYGYRLAREVSAVTDWYADYRCAGCHRGGALYLGTAEPQDARDIVAVHRVTRHATHHHGVR